MCRMLKPLLSVVVLLAMAFIAVTFIALEQDGVILVETRAEDGTPRVTHVWFAEDQGGVYLEAGNPNNPWVGDLESLKQIRITGEALDGDYEFSVHDTPEHHQAIRTLMRAKYGWRDAWIDILFDTSQSSLIELERVAPSSTTTRAHTP